jgi:hypothetical protein
MFPEKAKNEGRISISYTQLGLIVFVFLALLSALLVVLLNQNNPKLDNFGVDAAQGWQETGLRLEAGQRFTIEYLSGDWSISPADGIRYTADGGASACGNPDCVEPIPNYTKSGLIGRIGDAEAFPVGSYLESTATTSGTLQLRVNDAGTHDNEGIIRVRISSP